MTREEIVEAIADDKMMPYINPDFLPRIVDFVIDNYNPSLPSNLDEAAQRIAYDVCKQLPNGEEKDGIVYYAILAAIAGAEWMAGQFQKIEDIAEDHSTNFEKMAKEAEALDALADWWIENYCNKDAGFDEGSFHIGFCLGWQQHEKGMTAVEKLKAKKKVQDNPAPEKLIKNKS